MDIGCRLEKGPINVIWCCFLYVTEEEFEANQWTAFVRGPSWNIYPCHQAHCRSNSARNVINKGYICSFLSARFGPKPSQSYNEATAIETSEKFRWGYEDNNNSVALGINVKTFPHASQWFLFWPFGQLTACAWQECWNSSQAVWCCSCLWCWPPLHFASPANLLWLTSSSYSHFLFSFLSYLFFPVPTPSPSHPIILLSRLEAWEPVRKIFKWTGAMFALASLHFYMPRCH